MTSKSRKTVSLLAIFDSKFLRSHLAIGWFPRNIVARWVCEPRNKQTRKWREATEYMPLVMFSLLCFTSYLSLCCLFLFRYCPGHILTKTNRGPEPTREAKKATWRPKSRPKRGPSVGKRGEVEKQRSITARSVHVLPHIISGALGTAIDISQRCFSGGITQIVRRITVRILVNIYNSISNILKR